MIHGQRGKKEGRGRQKGGPSIALCCLRHFCCFHGENLHAKSQAGSTVSFLKNQKSTKLVSHIWKAVLLKDQFSILKWQGRLFLHG